MAANARVSSNVLLELLLARARWSPENLADRLNQLAAQLGWRTRVHRRTPRRWVYGDRARPGPCAPRQPWPGLVCHLLAQHLREPVTPELLGWPEAGPLRYVPATTGSPVGGTRPGQWLRCPPSWMLTAWNGDTFSR